MFHLFRTSSYILLSIFLNTSSYHIMGFSLFENKLNSKLLKFWKYRFSKICSYKNANNDKGAYLKGKIHLLEKWTPPRFFFTRIMTSSDLISPEKFSFFLKIIYNHWKHWNKANYVSYKQGITFLQKAYYIGNTLQVNKKQL